MVVMPDSACFNIGFPCYHCAFAFQLILCPVSVIECAIHIQFARTTAFTIKKFSFIISSSVTSDIFHSAMFEIALIIECSIKFYTISKLDVAFLLIPICVKNSCKYPFITLMTGATYQNTVLPYSFNAYYYIIFIFIIAYKFTYSVRNSIFGFPTVYPIYTHVYVRHAITITFRAFHFAYVYNTYI